jgi:signal transduction histidine kinase/ligand-binding sensor domain-containing protein/DNA-binding response OmpR family regulator
MKLKQLLLDILILIALALPLTVLAQVAPYPFRSFPPVTLGTSEGASCMLFNRLGLLIAGTNNGLKVYDGYTISSLRSDAYTPGLLPNNNIRCLAEDAEGNLWIGTRDGLTRYDQRTGQTRTFHLPYSDQRIIYTLHAGRNNKLWIGTDGGLSVLDTNTGKLFTYNSGNSWLKTPEGLHVHMPSYSVKAIVETMDGDLYIGTWNSGLFRLRKGSRTFERYPKLNDANSAYSLLLDNHGRLWVGSWGYGVMRIDNPKDVFHAHVTYYPFTPDHFDIFLHIIQDPRTHRIWASTREGVCSINPDEKGAQWQQYTAIGNTPLSYCNDLSFDPNGNLWVLTQNNGIIETTPTPSPFRIFSLDPTGFSQPGNFATAIHTDDGIWFWLGLNPYGIALYNRLTGQTLYNNNIPGFTSIPQRLLATSFTAITRRRNGDLWFADNNYGIIVRNAANKKTYIIDNTTCKWLKDNYVNTFLESRDGTMWIGTRSGLSRVTSAGIATAVTLKADAYDVSDCDIRGISEDRKGNLWLATDNEGIIYIPHTQLHVIRPAVRQYALRNHNLPVNDANAVYEDHQGRLWAISNSGGLFLLDVKANAFSPVNHAFHIPGDRVLAITEDNAGNLWLTTDDAIVRLRVKDGFDPTPEVSMFTQDDGLGNAIFSANSVCQYGDELFFGSRSGFIAFKPKTLNTGFTDKANIVVTGIDIDDEPWSSLNDSTLKAQISKETPEFTKKVTLSPSIRKVGFNFACLSYGNAQKTLYAYRLEGYDDKWNYCRENSHHAVFQNLPSGTYHLFIRATDSQGHWQQMPYSITVRVLPPWYASWWAYLIYLALLAIAVAAGIEWYKRHLKTQNSLRMGVILTNITHELLTPLTVISATIYKLRKQAPVYENEYQVIDGNINRLTRLLRQILEVRKSQAGQLRLKVTRGDLTAFVAQKAESIRPMAEEQLLLFNVNVPEKASMAWFDPDKLDKIIYNLLSNAIKYNREGGRVDLTLSFIDGKAVLTVADNGIGMSKSQLKHLYTRFFDGNYRIQNVGGTGLGLALVHELVLLHHGTINCQSEEGRGTIFSIYFPIKKSAYSPQETDTSEVRKVVDHATAKEIIAKTLNDRTGASLHIPHQSVLIKNNAPKVLLVEDNTDLLELMRQALSKHYKVLTARNGKQAWNIIQKEPLDLVISDVMMPVMDGLELTKLIKKDESFWQLPVILLTAKDKQEDKNEGYATGADAYITKPFSFEELILRADMLLTNREKTRERANKEVKSAATVEQPIHNSDPDKVFLEKAHDLVMKHIEESEYDRERFAHDMLVSSSTLYNKIRALTGKTITEYINGIRLNEACKILVAEPNVTIADVASRVGFNTPKYFSRLFKNKYGVGPKEWPSPLIPPPKGEG